MPTFFSEASLTCPEFGLRSNKSQDTGDHENLEQIRSNYIFETTRFSCVFSTSRRLRVHPNEGAMRQLQRIQYTESSLFTWPWPSWTPVVALQLLKRALFHRLIAVDRSLDRLLVFGSHRLAIQIIFIHSSFTLHVGRSETIHGRIGCVCW